MLENDCGCSDETWKVFIDTSIINALPANDKISILNTLSEILDAYTVYSKPQITAIIEGIAYTNSATHLIHTGNRDSSTDLLKQLTSSGISSTIRNTKLSK